MDTELFLLELEEHMQKACEYTLHEFSTVRTGKASPSLVEGIDIYIQAYSSNMKLKQLALISTPEPRLIYVKPFDPSTLRDIERGLKEANIGINPAVDGNAIRLPIPEMNQERRKEMVKRVKGMGEEGKVRVRSQRRDGMEAAKKAQKEGAISEDDLERVEEEIQKLTDKYTKEIDVHVVKKEAEIMTV
ncbi:MAG TPA: ribosome recycling factor [Verrucomicrobiales bacterium]|jgi:ribosome recycling factor|nr:ribosome recycling factor [Verrucomicrobiales bacterium]